MSSDTWADAGDAKHQRKKRMDIMLEQAFLCTVFPSKSRLITGQRSRANALSTTENTAGNGSHGNALTYVFSGYIPARPLLTFLVA